MKKRGGRQGAKRVGADRQARTFDAILEVVLELLESEGYDAVQPRIVAKRAHVSLTTIYKFFPTRDDLIVTAMSRWMEAHCYSGLADPPPDASLYDGLLWLYRQIFEPWQRHPRMLAAHHRARTGPGGERLDVQGMTVSESVARTLFEKVDPSYAKDLALIMKNMAAGAIQRFAAGDIPVTDILPILERTLFRLTGDNAALASPGTPRRPRSRRRPARR